MSNNTDGAPNENRFRSYGQAQGLRFIGEQARLDCAMLSLASHWRVGPPADRKFFLKAALDAVTPPHNFC
ncbi:hypothetical protein QA635_08510 [Bradyrhizobium brasilense]|uniref:hypothetical protein n=1 Tax=Bradyrhizobium brasilense TaxID=1419277 RepID=UPI0024B188E5|nr:hypothetical protein [Bradyrhizobium australafricanum]WFU34440.1 hypothetical protein QA635_08510 [Bradyrhizobium australafricanum]